MASASEKNVAQPAIRIELRNHQAKSVLPNRFWKLSIPNCFGMRSVELSVPSGLNAADATNRIGISAKMIAPMATRWRQPRAKNQFWPVIG